MITKKEAILKVALAVLTGGIYSIFECGRIIGEYGDDPTHKIFEKKEKKEENENI